MENKLRIAVLSFAILFLTGARLATAQGLSAMGPPIPTFIIVTRPAPGETFGGKTVVTMGVGTKTYKFILKDGYVNHMRVRWPDVWQYVKQYNPNFVVQGQGADTFEKIQPGQTVKIGGAFAPLNRTFEVVTVEPSGGGDQHF
jgi:hypothetical protein